jgi:hypothetical protein
MYVDHAAFFKTGARAYGDVEFTCPNGTASGWIDTEAGVMRIFTDPEVDPVDWEIICGMLHHIGVTDPGEPGYLSGVYTWTVNYREPVEEPRSDGTGRLVRVA